MHTGEALIGRIGEIRDVSAIAGAKQRQQIVAFVVPRADWGVRVLAGDHFEHRKRRSAEETLVGVDLDVLGMIDGEEAGLIEVIELFHGLEHLETDHAIFGLHLISGDFEIFVGVGNIALVGACPVADDSGADHVG